MRQTHVSAGASGCKNCLWPHGQPLPLNWLDYGSALRSWDDLLLSLGVSQAPSGKNWLQNNSQVSQLGKKGISLAETLCLPFKIDKAGEPWEFKGKWPGRCDREGQAERFTNWLEAFSRYLHDCHSSDNSEISSSDISLALSQHIGLLSFCFP